MLRALMNCLFMKHFFDFGLGVLRCITSFGVHVDKLFVFLAIVTIIFVIDFREVVTSAFHLVLEAMMICLRQSRAVLTLR